MTPHQVPIRGPAAGATKAVRGSALERLKLPALVSFIAPPTARSIALARRLAADLDGDTDGSQVWRHAPKES